jgi:hypothetical protein
MAQDGGREPIWEGVPVGDLAGLTNEGAVNQILTRHLRTITLKNTIKSTVHLTMYRTVIKINIAKVLQYEYKKYFLILK